MPCHQPSNGPAHHPPPLGCGAAARCSASPAVTVTWLLLHILPSLCKHFGKPRGSGDSDAVSQRPSSVTFLTDVSYSCLA